MTFDLSIEMAQVHRNGTGTGSDLSAAIVLAGCDPRPRLDVALEELLFKLSEYPNAVHEIRLMREWL